MVTVCADTARELGERGYFVRDGFLGPALAVEAHRAASALDAAGALTPAAVGHAHQHALGVRQDRTTWLDGDSPPALAEVCERFAALRDQLNEAAWLGLKRFDVQLACYSGDGAAYRRHLDAFASRNGRRVSALVYLNPQWQPAHGGQLRLHVAPAHDVEPTLDRLVVFLSEKVEHEVLPSFAQRFAITAWYAP